jgi:hypothetical protein
VRSALRPQVQRDLRRVNSQIEFLLRDAVARRKAGPYRP